MTEAPATMKPTQLAKLGGISVSYASMLLSGARVPDVELAVRLWRSAGIKLGPLATLPDADVESVARLLALAPVVLAPADFQNTTEGVA
jgi:hypothetical protein